MADKTAQPLITGTRVQNERIAFPLLAEQTAIATYLDNATADMDTAIDRMGRQIALLREYRTRLIADVVTGKLDVREAAARLPEVDLIADEDVVETVQSDVDSIPEEHKAAQEVRL